ncbi:MAG: MFS transporter [Acidobacteria bacterium]|nr:MFS transporter [Acidobacteriota bacterium]
MSKSVRTSLQATIILFLFILLFNYADQSLLSPLLNPLLSDFFGRMDNVVPLGWVSFVFTVLSALSMMAAGFLADRTSRIRICLAGCVLYGTVSLLTVFVPHGETGYAVFFIARALNGIGVGAVVPAIFSMIGDAVPARRRTTAFGFVSVAMLGGRLTGFLIAGAAVANWRWAYSVIGLISLGLAAGLLFVREPRRGAGESELQDQIAAGAEYSFRIQKKDLRRIWDNRSNFWLIVNFIDVIPGAIIVFLIFKYMQDVHNMAVSPVNFIILLVFIGGAAGSILFGRLGDWGFQKDKRAKVIIALVCNMLPILLMVVFLTANFRIPDGAGLATTLAVPGVWLLIAAVVTAVFINQGVNPNWYSSLTDVNLPENRSTMIALAVVMDMTGNALGPLFAAYAATQWGLRTAMWTVLLFWLANVFLWLPVLKHIRPDLARIHELLQKRAGALAGGRDEKEEFNRENGEWKGLGGGLKPGRGEKGK